MLRCTPIVLAAVVALSSLTSHAGSIHYVDDSAPPAGNGTSWNTAFRYLQDALAVAGGGDEGSIISNCYFVDNHATLFGGGFAAGGVPLVTNCIFARNSAPTGGGMLLSYSTVINCTFNENEGGAVSADGQTSFIQNSILWGNPPQEVVQFQSSAYTPTIQQSNVQGGYPGTGNIDANPLFVQPGANNFRLGNGSACLDAGLNSLLPSDLADLDGDGDTAEPLPIDFAGDTRIANGTVDMGAYEGSFDILPLAAINDDFDPGESVVLVPGGGDFLDEQTLAVRAFNQGTQHNATILVTDLRGMPRNNDGTQPMLRVETDLPPGQLRIRAKVPFTIESINGGDPLEPNLVRQDEITGGWSLAATKNVFINPAYNEPIGNRFVVEGSNTTLPSLVVGDYGVFWNPSTQRGFVWASVDQGGEFGRRNATCPGDGAPYGGNSVINVYDLLDLLRAWGHDNRWFDADSDGIVDGSDLFALFAAWGICD